MKFYFQGHAIVFYVGIISTILASILIAYGVSINGFIQPWTLLTTINILGYIMLAYIYLTEK
jgi:hypothetical protein